MNYDWRWVSAAVAIPLLGVFAAAGMFTNEAPTLGLVSVDNAADLIDPTGRTLIVSDPPERVVLSVSGQDTGGVDSLLYTWEILGPDRTTLQSGGSHRVQFAPEVAGEYTIRFRVEDGGVFGMNAKSAERIFSTRAVVPDLPIAAIDGVRSPIRIGETLTLDAGPSTVHPGSPAPRFRWSATVDGDTVDLGAGAGSSSVRIGPAAIG